VVEEVGKNSLVVLHCANPREKMWGIVVRLDVVGVVLRGLELASVDDWLRQLRSDGEVSLGPNTFLVPMHRVVRIDLDESGPAVSSFADRFRTDTGRDIRDELMASFGPDA
jgi:hypothetical protein